MTRDRLAFLVFLALLLGYALSVAYVFGDRL